MLHSKAKNKVREAIIALPENPSKASECLMDVHDYLETFERYLEVKIKNKIVGAIIAITARPSRSSELLLEAYRLLIDSGEMESAEDTATLEKTVTLKNGEVISIPNDLHFYLIIYSESSLITLIKKVRKRLKTGLKESREIVLFYKEYICFDCSLYF